MNRTSATEPSRSSCRLQSGPTGKGQRHVFRFKTAQEKAAFVAGVGFVGDPSLVRDETAEGALVAVFIDTNDVD